MDKYFTDNTNFKFKISKYWKELGKKLAQFETKTQLRYFNKKRLVEYASKEKFYEYKSTMKKLFEEINKILKNAAIQENEYVGTVKVLHLFAPNLFPLLDNKIAQGLGITKKNLSFDKYYEFLNVIQKWISHYKYKDIQSLEQKYGVSILRLIDEALYVTYSFGMDNRIKEIYGILTKGDKHK